MGSIFLECLEQRVNFFQIIKEIAYFMEELSLNSLAERISFTADFMTSYFASAIGCSPYKFYKKLPELASKYDMYIDKASVSFAEIDGIELHVAPEDYMEPNYWLNTITVDPDKFGMDYEQLRQVLDKANIESRPLWKPMHMQPVFKDAPAYINGVSESLFKVGLCLPSGPMVTDDDLNYIIETIMSKNI